MISAAFAKSPGPAAGLDERPRFRGRDIRFWQKEIFQGLRFLELAEIESQTDLTTLVLFNPCTFLEIDAQGTRELCSRSEVQNPRCEDIFTLEGNPLFVVPARALEPLLPHIESENLLERLLGLKNLEPIDLEASCRTLDVRKDIKAIESAIIDYQISLLLRAGVVIEDFHNFYTEGVIPIGSGTIISSGVVLKGETRIGKDVTIYPNSYLENATVGDNCTILPGCIIRDSILEQDVRVGPFTHLRNDAVVKKGAKMGNFVEMKKSVLGEESKAMHLTYIGDAEIGRNVNIGAGTITCNYDGEKKHKTIIKDNVFIGSGTELIAPVTIEKNSYVAAGSTINEDVPQDSLGVARQKQRNILDWVKRKTQSKKPG